MPSYYVLPPYDALDPVPTVWQTFPAHQIVGVWDTIVAINTDSRSVFGMSAQDGKELWRIPNFYSPEKAAIFPPVTDGKHVWLTLTDTLYAVRAADGKLLFEAPMQGEIACDAVLVGGHVVALVSKIEGDLGARERHYYIQGYDISNGKVKFSMPVGKTTEAMFAADKEAFIAYAMLRRMDATSSDRFSLMSFSIPDGNQLSTGLLGDINGRPKAAFSRLAVAGTNGVSVYMKDSLAKPLNRFSGEGRGGAADVTMTGKKAVFVQGPRVTAADVNSPAIPYVLEVEKTAPGEIPSLASMLLMTVGQRLVYPAIYEGKNILIAFDAPTGMNVRASKGLDGITSFTYFKNFLIAANGRKTYAVNLDKMLVLQRKPTEKQDTGPAPAGE